MPALKDRGTRGAGGASGATGYPYGQARSARGRWTRREEGRRDKKALGAVGGGVDGGRGGRNGLGGPVRRPAVRPPEKLRQPGTGPTPERHQRRLRRGRSRRSGDVRGQRPQQRRLAVQGKRNG